MAILSKRRRDISAKVEQGKSYQLDEAITLLQAFPTKFNQSMDLAIVLGVNVKNSAQTVRSSSVLPNGTGKSVKVAVFAQDEQAKKAKDAGADIVGFDDLAAQIKSGFMDFDVVIATPDSMRIVGQLGQVLGPRGLMPNPKVGTVTTDVETAVKNAKAGQVQFRTDKAGILHCTVGKINFTVEQLRQNIEHLIKDVVKAKPVTAKGTYLKKIVLSSTMGPGLVIDQTSI